MNEATEPKVKATEPKVNRDALHKQEQELAFWKQCYCAALACNAGNGVNGFAKQVADAGVSQLRSKLNSTVPTPTGDCVSKV
jgi:hypothetical protein